MDRLLFFCQDIESIKLWICINYDVDCETEDLIRSEYPFFHHILQKDEPEASLDDVEQLLKVSEIEYVLSLDDISRKTFYLREGIKQVDAKNLKFGGERWYFNDTYEDNPKGPFLKKRIVSPIL